MPTHRYATMLLIVLELVAIQKRILLVRNCEPDLFLCIWISSVIQLLLTLGLFNRFSPGPCPVEWYEYFLIVGLVVFFSHFMDSTVTKWLRQAWGSMMRLLRGEQEQDDIDGKNFRPPKR